jgi:prevent-host-death family protein
MWGSGWGRHLGYQNYDIVGIRRKTMTVIKPISDLRNRAKEISRLCHRENRPVFITRNGENDLVVMSQAHYDRLVARLDLYQNLDEAEVQARPGGGPRAGHRAVMRRLRTRLG